MLRFDLEAAEIPYRNDAGRVADFHSLRHTCISNLAAGGVHPKTAQSLARHSDIALTMTRYTHSYREQEIDALASLPDLSDLSQRAAARATGPEEVGPSKENLASCLALLGEKSPDLALVVESWDGLPEAIRTGIVAMVRAAMKSKP
jgi:hypothetical protein